MKNRWVFERICVSLHVKDKVEMKRLISIMFSMWVVALSVEAQSPATSSQNASFGKKVSKFWKNTKKGVRKASGEIGGKLGIQPKHLDEYKVHGTYYMMLYRTNLYKGEDGDQLCKTCIEQFQAKYPNAEIESCVCPQQEWLSEEVVQETVVGYLQTMFCYIVARDGTDGYINAKFCFGRYKDVGKAVSPLIDMWPKWERTDVIPINDYRKLCKKIESNR